ncbi:hypothetical protein [Amycolatopsis dongchuanensis]|uniref:Serine/threonine protein kinase n=1 Tax=Amycolatopsis dongchuanensis TaxID=1070866 RepID=A0ABP9QTD6_9PSEU
MARAGLRSRPGDIVTAIQMADRTGIVAHSAPPAAEEPKPVEITPSVLVAATEPQRPAGRRVRRNLAFTCAAALFLVAGWVSGGMFGQQDPEPTPALAVGTVPAPVQSSVQPSAEPPATREVVPAPQAPQTTAPAVSQKQVVPSGKRTSKTTTTTPAKPSVQERADLPDADSGPLQDPVDSLGEQLERMFGPWTWGSGGTQVYRSHDFHVYGR